MTRTITALFDTHGDADAGAARLKQAGIDASNINIHDNASHQTGGTYSDHQDMGMWAKVKNAFLPDADRHAYEEGVRRGGFLLTADVDDNNVDAAVAALEEAHSVDLDDRSAQWKADGWDLPGRQLWDDFYRPGDGHHGHRRRRRPDGQEQPAR